MMLSGRVGELDEVERRRAGSKEETGGAEEARWEREELERRERYS